MDGRENECSLGFELDHMKPELGSLLPFGSKLLQPLICGQILQIDKSHVTQETSQEYMKTTARFRTVQHERR